MLLKLIYLFVLLQSSQARYGFSPKFFGQDSAVIVDTDKPLPPSDTHQVPSNSVNKLRFPPPFPMWQHFPRYRIIPPPHPGQILAINTWSKNFGQKGIGKISTTSSGGSVSTTAGPIISTPAKEAITTTTSITSTTIPPYTTNSPPIVTTYSPPITTTPSPITTTISPITTTILPITTTTPTSESTITSSSINSINKNSNSKFDIDTVPFVTDDEFPKELLDIAQNKLGLKSLDEIPSISELGQLLGTNSPQETLSYIKQLTANEHGVALMKAYIESTDYTDNSGDLNDNKNQDEDYTDDDLDAISEIDEPLKINDEGLVVISDDDANEDYETAADKDLEMKRTNTLKPSRKTPKILNKLKELSDNKPGFFERIANYMHINNLWHKKVENTKQESDEIPVLETTNLNDYKRVSFLGKNMQTAKEIKENDNSEEEIVTELPILVRDPIPFNYPVPIRPQTSTTTSTPSPITTTTIANPPNPTTVHLNTPKMLIPHVQNLAKATKISPRKIEDFLATKPKLIALANKVSRFPIGYDRNSPLEAQVMMAVQRAIEHDDDLKKLLNSTATLK